jgi:hypothetical protein
VPLTPAPGLPWAIEYSLRTTRNSLRLYCHIHQMDTKWIKRLLTLCVDDMEHGETTHCWWQRHFRKHFISVGVEYMHCLQSNNSIAMYIYQIKMCTYVHHNSRPSVVTTALFVTLAQSTISNSGIDKLWSMPTI